MQTEIVVVESSPQMYNVAVTHFLDSPGWVYLTHRYGTKAQGTLLRLLTLSGLDPWAWEACAMQLVLQRPPESAVRQAMHSLPDELRREQIQAAVTDIRAFAAAAGASLGEPPPAPSFLAGYGYTQPDYLADLELLHGSRVAARYTSPWPETSFALQRPLIRRDLPLRRAVAMMGATAGAIERLMTVGVHHDPDD